MIQRVQTIYLLLVTLACIALILVPFGGIAAVDGTLTPLIVKEMLIDAVAVSMIGLIAFISIFLFKNRKRQLKIVLFNIVLSFGLIGLFAYGIYAHVGIKNYVFKFGAILPIFILIFNVLAYAGIKSDENLVRSMDRLR